MLKQRIGLFLAAAVWMLLGGCGSDNNSGANTSGVHTFDYLQGIWKGSWNNQTAETTGTAQVNITVNDLNQTAAFVVILTGNVLGTTDPPAQVLTGTFNASALTVRQTSSTFGDVSVTIGPSTTTNNINGSAVNLPNAAVNRIGMTGSVSGTTMSINFSVALANGAGTQTGVVTLTKQP